MEQKSKNSSNVFTISCELLLVLFILWVISEAWDNSMGQIAEANNSGFLLHNNGEPGSALLPVQGTTLVATIKGSIATTDRSFIGQRHTRTNIRGDRTCTRFGVVGKRYYDEVLFQNTSATLQKVTIGFVSGCGNNTFMAAYTPQFDPNNICNNFIAHSGLSGNVVWEFTVCGYSQFSIVVYGSEPNLLCKDYSYTVYGEGIKLSPGTNFSEAEKMATSETPDLLPDLPAFDVKIKRKKPKEDRDTRIRMVLPDPIPSEMLIATQGTPIAAIVNDSITASDRTFFSQRHFRSGIPGDTNCALFGIRGPRNYDEVIFFNTSPSPRNVIIDFASFCGFNTYAVAYSPQFNPTNICAGYLAGAGVSGNRIWGFTICGNSQFSIVVYGLEPGLTCGGYRYTVYGEGLASSADIAVSKVATSGSAAIGSDITYLLTVSNNSLNAVGNVTLQDNLPSGTTFVSMNLISTFGTALPAPSCVTPAVGQPGMVTCALNLIGGQGTFLPSTLTFALTAKLVSANFRQISNTALVSFLGTDPLLSNNSSTAVVSLSNPFDICVQDESNGNILKLNSSTGEYQFKACGTGFVVGGTGIVAIRGNTLTLQHVAADRRVQAQADIGSKKGRASIQMLSIGANFTVTDNDISNNSCVCN